MSITYFRDSQASFALCHTSYQSGIQDSHDVHNMSASATTTVSAISTSMIWSPFQVPTSADQTQRVWRDDGKVEVSRRASNWKAKRVTIVAAPTPSHISPLQTASYIEFMGDPPSIHLELSDCSICTPIFEDREI